MKPSSYWGGTSIDGNPQLAVSSVYSIPYVCPFFQVIAGFYQTADHAAVSHDTKGHPQRSNRWLYMYMIVYDCI